MSETKTNLRQANAKVKVAGIVSSKELKIEEKEGQKVITGSVSIEVDETNIVRFFVKADEKKKDGSGDNVAYKGLVTVMNEFKTIADNGREAADRVYVNGDLNLFTGQNGKENIGQRASFFNRAKKLDSFEPEATYDVEVFIKAIVPEMNTEGEETGRVLVKGWVPTYNGIEPITLIADKDLADGVQEFSPNQTVRFFGDIINSRVEVKKEIPMKLGKPRIETQVSYKNELLITGASDAYEEGVSKEKPYEKATIDLAINEREAKLKDKERQSKGSENPFNQNRPSGGGRQLNF